MVDTRPPTPRITGLYLRNLAANLTGNLLIALLNIVTPIEFFRDWQDFLWQGGYWVLVGLLPVVFATAIILQNLTQRPLAVFIEQNSAENPVNAGILNQARRRLLNLPLLLGLINLVLWTGVTFIFIPVLLIISNIGIITGVYVFFRGAIIGLIAAFISFYLIDDYSRRNLIPVFFPNGRLSSIGGTRRVSILRRIRVLYLAGTGAPALILMGTLALVLGEMDGIAISAKDFAGEIFWFILVLYAVFVPIALSLNVLVGKSILTPISSMMSVVDSVHRGDFKQRVVVESNDQLGLLSEGMNDMTRGLIERERMRRSLNLAKEVQQALLPGTDPKIKGLDIASTTVYCDETGGDYYDFLIPEDARDGNFTAVVGDVSGHGVSSALLMATARAFIRQRSGLSGSISNIVTDVNRLLTRDVAESGGFMTLFYLAIDPSNRNLRWVRAGHDPAIVYDAASDSFEELRGAGMALGVDADAYFEENQKDNLTKSQIILLGTDGIWEARNSRDQMFGKEPIFRIIRANRQAGAGEILTACFNALDEFLEGRDPEDDLTMIVIKIIDD